MYGVELNLSSQFSGSIVWSVTSNSNIYATEEVKIDVRQAFVLTILSWFLIAIFGSIPFIYTDTSLGFTDSFFESEVVFLLSVVLSLSDLVVPLEPFP